jgi:hypothetical protein
MIIKNKIKINFLLYKMINYKDNIEYLNTVIEIQQIYIETLQMIRRTDYFISRNNIQRAYDGINYLNIDENSDATLIKLKKWIEEDYIFITNINNNDNEYKINFDEQGNYYTTDTIDNDYIEKNEVNFFTKLYSHCFGIDIIEHDEQLIKIKNKNIEECNTKISLLCNKIVFLQKENYNYKQKLKID